MTTVSKSKPNVHDRIFDFLEEFSPVCYWSTPGPKDCPIDQIDLWLLRDLNHFLLIMIDKHGGFQTYLEISGMGRLDETAKLIKQFSKLDTENNTKEILATINN